MVKKKVFRLSQHSFSQLWLVRVDIYECLEFLVYREIQQEIYRGTDLSKMTISYPECRCPTDYPVLVRDSNDPSGVFCRSSNSDTKVTRLLNGTVDSLRDDNLTTFWSSSDDTPTVFFMFEQIFMVSACIEIHLREYDRYYIYD